MAEDRREPESPTELGLRFGLPVAGLGEMANLGEAGAVAGALPLMMQPGSPIAADFRAGGRPQGLPLDDGLQTVPGQSGGEGLA